MTLLRVTTMVLLAVTLTASAASSAVAQSQDPGRLYGRVTTMDGDVFEGFIRWDKNEGHWVDILNASKRIPGRHVREARRLSGRDEDEGERGVRVFGIRVGSWGDWDWSNSASSGIRVGHVRALQVLDDDHALVILKSGEEQELRASSTDLGTSNRGIIVRDVEGRGEVELTWDDLDEIEFMPAPSGVSSRFGRRQYGTLVTRRGDEFTGWITWDMDEIFGTDELDGRDGRRRRAIEFENVASIERSGSSRSVVTLNSGEEIVLRGTNDVNDDNRGIAVGDLGLGQVTVEWSEFSEVRFFEPPQNSDYSGLDGGRRISGTVYTVDGESFTGRIRWDNDEEWTWEQLDGEDYDMEFDVEFGLIRSIQRDSYRSAVVTLLDGRAFTLRGSNDVNEDNKGIFVEQDNGETVMVHWEDFDRVDLDQNR